MPVSPHVPVTPAVLAWALRESGLENEQLARKLGVKTERLNAWLAGEAQPTMRQVQNFARHLQRPFSIFFLSEPPALAPLAADYRRLPGVEIGKESPGLRLALRQMMNRREVALELHEELGLPVKTFDAVARLSEPADQVGERLRALLAIDFSTQLAWASPWEAWRAWRGAVEAAGVLVFQFSKVELSEVRGLCLLDMPLPVVGVNGKESVPEAKAFTLLHEVAHLMLAASQEERPALHESRSPDQWLGVERFAERVASHALVPPALLRQVIDQVGLVHAQWSVAEVRRLSNKVRITPLAMATRLRESGYMTWARYGQWRDEWDAYVATLTPRAGGFATPAEKALSRHGRPFARLVLEAMQTNHITAVDAARHLDLKYQHFGQLTKELTGLGTGEMVHG